MLQPELFEDTRIRRLGRAEIGYRHSTSILNKGVGSLAGVDYALNPYVGCQFGCSYCYAAFFQADADKIANWGNWVDVKENALALVRRSRNLAGKTIYIGSATDPYQPIEAKLHLTRSILEYLATIQAPPRVIVQTRSPLVAQDIDVLQKLMGVRVNMSITTDDDAVRRAFEPSCPSIERRVQALADLAAAGIDARASLCPLLPMRDPAGFVRRLHGLGIRRLWAGVFHEGTRPFAAGTGAEAKRIAREMAWMPETAKRQVREVLEETARLGMKGRS